MADFEDYLSKVRSHQFPGLFADLAERRARRTAGPDAASAAAGPAAAPAPEPASGAETTR